MLGLLVFFGLEMTRSVKQGYLPGITTSGHHQIEIACDACHTPFGGVKQEACLECHGEELDAATDSHAPSIFNDPRYLGMLESIDATLCVTCHNEHIVEQSGDKTANVPADFCMPCHNDIENERPSHRGFAEEGCAAAGCHNYHDNRALYEDFLKKHLDEPAILAGPFNMARYIAALHDARVAEAEHRLSAKAQDSPAEAVDPVILAEWSASAHATSGVNCSDCHASPEHPGGTGEWTDHPPDRVCDECHETQATGFFQGKHGMRIAQHLPPMQPRMARIEMKPKAADRSLGCNSCHGPHRYDTRLAAVEACMKCHDDTHTRSYPHSPHHRLWQMELEGQLPPGSGVSCATCHLPRETFRDGGKLLLRVNHNQNQNLRPNTKMARDVCMNCHGLEFSLNSLADPDLLLNNYSGQPTRRIDSMEMVRKRLRGETGQTPEP